jgi:hypothetical protein
MADYYSIIAPRLPGKTDEARHAIYERARAALREALSNYDPALSDTEQAALETAISRLEVDLSTRRGAIAKYILALLLGSVFLAGLVTLLRTERIYLSQAVSQSATTGQPTFPSQPGRKKTD